MTPGGAIDFPPFRLDSIEEQLWRGKQKVILQRRPFTVLSYLLRHPGNLITKEELVSKVWQGTTVTDETLKVCIEKIRKALHDDPQAPRFVETVRGRGYRFIGKVTSSLHAVGNSLDQSGVRGPGFEVQNAQSTLHTSHSMWLVGRLSLLNCTRC
jgi:DNA-binding winged helix-turn-helix (wHTH) protein